MNDLLPTSIEAEEAILGGILIDPDAIARIAEQLCPEFFAIAAHKIIYRSALSLFLQGKPVDLMVVTDLLTDNNQLAAVGGLSKLAQLVDRTVSAVNIDEYAKLVEQKYQRRRLIEVGNNIVKLGYETATPLDTVLDLAEQEIFNVTQERVQQDLVPIGETLNQTFNQLEQLNEGLTTPGIPCGFYDLDAMTGGFQRSDLIIVAARPAIGKTSFCTNIAHHITKQGQPIAFFSLEMSKEQLVQRILSGEAKIESNRIRSGRIGEGEWERISRAIGELSELPLFIDDTPSITVNEIRSKARRLQLEQNGELGAIVIDYLQLMEGTSPNNRVQELSQITRSLKGLARELNVPIIALSQLNRGVEARQDKRPLMSDLRESGCLSGDTLITLADTGARVPIRELVGQSGFSVWALSETTMKLEKAIVSNAFATGIKPVFRLRTRLGREIKATTSHKLLTIYGWKRLDELNIGDRIALPRQVPTTTVMQTMSSAEVALLGHLIGDGCTLGSHAIQYTTGRKELADIVGSLATEVFGDRVKPRITKERTWYQAYLPASRQLTHDVRNPVAEWLTALGVFDLRSHEKYVPDIVFQQPRAAIALFLRNLWCTDGTIHLAEGKRKYPGVSYTSSSRRLAKDVQSLLLIIGIQARLSTVPQSGKGRDQYHVCISGSTDLSRFVSHIGGVDTYQRQAIARVSDYLKTHSSNTNKDVIPNAVWQLYAVPAMRLIGLTTRKMQFELGNAYCGTTLYKQNLGRERALKLGAIVGSDKLSQLGTSDIYWDRIESITPHSTTDVYDLTVPVLHNFLADNIVVHNSLEQDSDLVVMLYRDEYYNPDTPDRGIAEVIITKHRHGPTGTIKLAFDAQFTAFRNLALPKK